MPPKPSTVPMRVSALMVGPGAPWRIRNFDWSTLGKFSGQDSRGTSRIGVENWADPLRLPGLDGRPPVLGRAVRRTGPRRRTRRGTGRRRRSGAPRWSSSASSSDSVNSVCSGDHRPSLPRARTSVGPVAASVGEGPGPAGQTERPRRAGVAGDERLDGVAVQGSGHQEPLALLAAELDQPVELALVLDAFGDDLEAEARARPMMALTRAELAGSTLTSGSMNDLSILSTSTGKRGGG